MKTQNEVMNDDKLMWESFVSREADDQPYDGMDDAQKRFEDETMAQHAMSLMKDEEGTHRDFITWVADSIRAIGKEEFEAKFEALIQDIEGNTDKIDRVPESTDSDVKDLQALHDNPDEEFAKKNYGSVQAYKDMLKKKIDKMLDEAQGMRQRDASKGTSGAYRSAQGKELQAQQRRQALAKKAPKREPKKHGPFTLNP
tara:strand:+ start:365 stop:961 length:597 start_codon:yes stop_codon:yes gene_type:complete